VENRKSGSLAMFVAIPRPPFCSLNRLPSNIKILASFRLGRGAVEMDQEPEVAWLRRRIIRLRAAFRYALEPCVETILREIIADMEDRLERLEAELIASAQRRARKKAPQSN